MGSLRKGVKIKMAKDDTQDQNMEDQEIDQEGTLGGESSDYQKDEGSAEASKVDTGEEEQTM